MEIKRDHYLNSLIRRKGNGLIKVITGIRRCGKSYLLNTIFYKHLISEGVPEDHIIRFAFDSADDLSLIGESLIQLEKKIEKSIRRNLLPIFGNLLVTAIPITSFLTRFSSLTALKLF